MTRGAMTSLSRGTTGMSLDQRFTMIRSSSPQRSNRGTMRGRSRGRGRPTSSLKSRQLVEQMESRPAVRAALKLKRTPLKADPPLHVKQRLSLRGGRGAAIRSSARTLTRAGSQSTIRSASRNRRSSSVGSVRSVPLRRTPSLSNLSSVGRQPRGGLRRSSSMTSLTRGPVRNNRGGRGGSRIFRRNSTTSPGNRVGGGAIQKLSASRGRGGNRINRGRGRGGTVVNNPRIRRNSISNGARRNNLKRPVGGGLRSRSNSVSRAPVIQQINRGSPKRGVARRGRGGIAGRGGRGGGGRGAKRGSTPVPNRAQLDAQLDQYMAKTKAHLDKELDSYMSHPGGHEENWD